MSNHPNLQMTWSILAIDQRCIYSYHGDNTGLVYRSQAFIEQKERFEVSKVLGDSTEMFYKMWYVFQEGMP